MERIEIYLEKMLGFEEKGERDAALILAERLLETFPEHQEQILLEKGKLEFREELYGEALIDLINAYEISLDEEIYNLIMEAYYMPNKDVCIDLYNHNIEILKDYPHYKNSYNEELDVFPIWQDDELLVCVDIEEKIFASSSRGQMREPKQNDIYCMLNIMWQEDIMTCEEHCRISEKLLDRDIPMYLVYDKLYWMLFLQLYDLQELVNRKRIVFLVGREAFKEYFQELATLIPEILDISVLSEYKEALNEVIQSRIQEYERKKKEAEAYYCDRKQDIIRNIQSGKPRILFYTSRFTTVLQYHTRDCKEAAERLGCETELLIESDGLHRVSETERIKVIAEFKPDIIFIIDHFRFEYSVIPNQIVWITWVQDPMPHIMDKNTPAKLGDRDFVMNHYITKQEFFDIGYKEEYLIDAPVPANQNIYKKYDLTEEEKNQYTCDICFVCHASDVDNYIVEQLKHWPEELWEMIASMCKGYQSYAYETGKFFYNKEEFKCFIEGTAEQQYQIKLSDKALKILIEDMYQINQRIFRQVLVDWILEAGYTNIKLWGNGWNDHEKYRDYAMGEAKNGETLSKIYQTSKIVVGNNIYTTSAARAWESMLSGTFYMSNYIPSESDDVDIRKIVEIDKDVVMFKDREDLLEKIDYYLKNEDKRQEMIERGKKVALEKMTFDKLIEQTLKTIGERLEEK